MKNALGLALVLMAQSVFAGTSVILQTECDSYQHDSIVSYKTSAVANDNRVKAVVRLTERDSSVENSGSYDIATPIISSLVRQGDQIVDKASGQVCAKWRKRSFISGRDWVPTTKCRFETNDVSKVVLDSEGFEYQKTCTRQFTLKIKPLKQ